MTDHTTYDNPNEIPYGCCYCGCGRKTNICKKTNATTSDKRGEPFRFLKGHSTIRPYTAEYFWSRVNTRSADECWEWIDGRDSNGYGVFTHKRKRIRATHRSWEITNGPVPKGLWLLHKCDNPPCVNPNHLYLGTPANNVADRVARLGKTPGADINAKLTVAQVKEIRSCYAQGGVAYSELGRDYGVTASAIRLIVRRKNWAHVP